MKCRDCKWMYTNDTLNGLYICANVNSDRFDDYTGVCAEDECSDGEGIVDDERRTNTKNDR